MTEESLSSILESEEVETAEVNETETPEETEAPEAEQEQVEEKVEPTAAPEKEESWTKQAVLDERRKRQELEGKYTTSETEKAAIKAKLDEATKKLESANTKVEEVSKRPDMFEDPDGFANYTETKFEKAVTDNKIAMSVSFLKMLKDDYSDMEKVFLEKVAPTDPTYIQQLRASENPAKFAYDKAKEFLDHEDYVSNKESYAEWKKAQEAAKAEAEQEESPSEKAKKSIRKVPDLLNATSAKTGIDDKDDLRAILGK